jgi:hypothetical protein
VLLEVVGEQLQPHILDIGQVIDSGQVAALGCGYFLREKGTKLLIKASRIS